MTHPFLRRLFSLFCLLTALTVHAQPPKQKAPIDYVNPFIGTGGEGHCYPGATVPFGMVQPGPDTRLPEFNKKAFPSCAGYQYADDSIIGFSQTHFSGTGHSDLGDVLIMPFIQAGTAGAPLTVVPRLGVADTANRPRFGLPSRISKKEEWAEPGYYAVVLQDSKIKTEITATNRVALYKFTYPAADTAGLMLDMTSSIYNYDGKVVWSGLRVENDSTISGYRQTKGWAADRKIFFVMRFSKPFTRYHLTNDETVPYRGFGKQGRVLTNYPEQSGKKVKAYLTFSTRAGEPVLVKIALSAVGIDGAMSNLTQELPHWNFDGVRADARRLWEQELSQITVEASEPMASVKEQEIFYTAVYHSKLAPVTYMDVDKRYRGVDGNIHTATNFTNYTIYSLWDTYRAEHPLFTLTQPNRVGDMVQSMLAHQEQSVHKLLPVWSFHANETWCMIGYHAVSVIADAYLKGIKNFDAEKAFAAMKQSATCEYYGGLREYMKLGYVAQDVENEGASKTLEYAYDDWTIARMAQALGKKDDYTTFLKRAHNYTNVWDKNTGFMRAKKSDGTWNLPFDPIYAQYGGDYTEGNAWQYSWYVPQDVQGLIQLMGGNTRFTTKLDSLFILKDSSEKYKHVEDISGLIGQYAHGNEPSQHIAYLYNYAGAPWKTQEKIHQIMNNLFDNTPDGIYGNEDCGQMSAWYIFSSMGFYPVCPGSLEYVIGTPRLGKVVMRLDSKKTFTVIAKNLSEENFYIQSATLNGKPFDRSYITHEEITKGGELVFTMGSKPNKNWAVAKTSAPYSLSK